jgi:amino acid adenylation domain-containing protein
MPRTASDPTPPPLSAAQRRLLLAHKVEPASPEFTAAWAARLDGDLDLNALSQAWHAVVTRHAELRLRVEEVQGLPARSSWPAEDFPLAVRDIEPGTLPGELAAAVVRVFDVIGGRLVQAEVLRLGPQEHVLVVTAHHSVMDGRSVQVIARHLMAVYSGEEPAWPAHSYLDYVASESQDRPSGEELDAWLRDIALPERRDPLGLKPIARDQDKSGTTVRLDIPPAVWTALRARARELRTTPQVLGLSAFAITLSRYTDAADLVIGGSMDTRSSAFADTVGMFVNPTPVAIRIDEDAAVRTFCQSVHHSLLRAYKHRNVPFEEVVQRLRLSPDLSRSPVFEVLFNFVARPFDAIAGEGLRMAEVDLPEPHAKYDLTMVLRDRGDAAELVATYRTSRYDRRAIEQLTEHTATVLAQLPAATGTVGDLEMISAADRAALLAAGRGPALREEPRPVHEIVAALAAAEPERPAVTCGRTTLSYGELDSRADAFAAALTATGARPGSAVAILLEPCAEMIVAALAAWRIGACYVPLNLGFPVARLSSIIADVRPAVLVADPGWAQRLPGVTVLPVGDVPHVVPAPPRVAVDPSDTAYVIYTSGTSGEPKGVVVPHATLATSTAARHQVYGPHETFLLLSPLSFDSSVAGVWGTLSSGGRLVVARPDDVRDPERTLDLIASEHVTATLAVPSLYAGLLTAAERRGADRLRSVREVVLAGEALPDSVLSRHFALGQVAVIANEYGPTEATVWSTYRRFTGPEPIDIGRPIPGASVYLLDRTGRLVPSGAAGELVIGGAGVADGYLNRPEDTAEVFVTDPFTDSPARMYRSGDRARWVSDRLEFLGRRDDMVKLRGHRIELGAVEAACRSCAHVSDVAVQLAPEGERLIAFLVVEPGFDEAAARETLRATLPQVMVPAVIQAVAELPRTWHGKVDQRALHAMMTGAVAAVPVAPSGRADLTTLVREAWCEVLKCDTVPADANFFDVGGHSLLVLALQAAIESRTGTALDVLDLFNATTIEAQAALLAPPSSSTEEPAAVQPSRRVLATLRQARLTGRARLSTEDVR